MALEEKENTTILLDEMNSKYYQQKSEEQRTGPPVLLQDPKNNMDYDVFGESTTGSMGSPTTTGLRSEGGDNVLLKS